ncbi:hypothetical protein F5884DRAFT_496444 [Xylogone sp. PMI_703]|nr:hypothetical protein F5884DRAFT_496444 [Xylogone sp. PMI_703]
MDAPPPLPPSYPAYQSNAPNNAFYEPANPPAPPPKPNSQEASRRGTPAGGTPFPLSTATPADAYNIPGDFNSTQRANAPVAAPIQVVQDPGDNWLPELVRDVSKQDLADILAKPELLAALAHSTKTAPPSVAAGQEPLKASLAENISLATHLKEVESRLEHLRSSTQAQLLSTHALERQWRQKQSDMDRALAPFSPSSLYQRLSQGVQEQEMVCRALEESFLEGDGGVAAEREVTEWVRRYREAKKLYYSRRERKERWDEGRVGGWR